MKTDVEPVPEHNDGDTFAAELIDVAPLAATDAGDWSSVHIDIAFASSLFLEF